MTSFPSIFLYVFGLQSINLALLPLSVYLLSRNNLPKRYIYGVAYISIYILFASLIAQRVDFFVEAAYWILLSYTTFTLFLNDKKLFIKIELFFVFLSFLSIISFVYMFIYNGGITEVATPNGRNFVLAFSFATENIWTSLFPIYRQNAIFEEPGIFGTFLSVVLAGSFLRGRFFSLNSYILLVGLFCTFSLFGIFLLILFISVFSLLKIIESKKASRRTFWQILVFIMLLFISSIYLHEALNYILGRFTSYFTGDTYGDTRSHLFNYNITNFSIADYILGTSDLEKVYNPAFSSAHISSHVILYGFGLLLFFMFSLLYNVRTWVQLLAVAIVIPLSLYQRPDFFFPAYYFVLMTFANIRKYD